MKTPALCSLILAAMLLSPSSAISASYGDIYVSLVDGDVLIQTEDTRDWVPAAANTPLGESDRLWVADRARSELRLPHGRVMRLNSRTALEVGAVDQSGYRFFVDAGDVYVNVEERSGDAIVIETPAATIRLDQRSSLRIDVDQSGEVSLSVAEGMVTIDRPYGDWQLASGQRLLFRPDWPRPQFAALRSPDAFDTWNRARDYQQFRAGPTSPSRRYLPEELGGYAADFDQNGRWVDTPDYGYVWTPTAVFAGGWSPYRSGRWVWMRGNYVWISSDNWGWVPHHYGRWAFVRPFGWCWVPPVRRQVYWGPGYVGWVHTTATLSWVPLAPREVYYGRGFYGPQSVDVGRFPGNVSTSQNVNLYRNVRIPNAVTTVHRDTFLTGKPIVLKAQPNPFLERRTVSPPPSIKPETATTMPQIREVRSSERPPTHLFMKRAERNTTAPPVSPATVSSGAAPAPPKTVPSSVPVSSKDRSSRSPKMEGTVSHDMVPVPSAPPPPAVVSPGAGPSLQPPAKATTVRPADVPGQRPFHDTVKGPQPPQTTRTSDAPKNPVSSAIGRGEPSVSTSRAVVKETSPPLSSPKTVQKSTPQGVSNMTAPLPKPSTSVIAPVTRKAPVIPPKPPAPDGSGNSDAEKERYGRQTVEQKNQRQGIEKGGPPEREGRPGKETRPEGETR